MLFSRKIQWVGALLLTLFLLGAAPVAAQADHPETKKGGTLRVKIHNEIGWQQVALVRRALREVENGAASMLILEIHTPGGRLDMTRKMVTLVQNIRKSKAQTVAFVNYEALSAGAIIALSTGRIYMRENSLIGDAYPVQLGPLQQIQQLPPAILEKQLSVMRKEMEGLAQAFPEGRRRDVALLAKAMIDPGIQLRQVAVKNKDGVSALRLMNHTDEDLAIKNNEDIRPLKYIAKEGELLTLGSEQAREYGLADGVVADWNDFLSIYDIPESDVREIKLTARERFVDFLESISFFLLLGGLLCGIMAFKIPGFGVPEVLALACFFLLFLAHYLTGLSDWLEPLLFLVGVVLIAFELFLVPGTFVSGILGGLLVILGLILSFQSFIFPETDLQMQFLSQNLRYMVGAVLFVICSGWLISRLIPGIPFLQKVILEAPGGAGRFTSMAEGRDLVGRANDLSGKQGRSLSSLRPVGRAEFAGEILDVQTEGEFLDAGVAIEITRVDSNRIMVKEISTKEG